MKRPRYLTSSSPQRETGRGGLMEQIREHLGKKPDLVLFRNQSGSVHVDGRWQTYGLTKGASDLIGILSVDLFPVVVRPAWLRTGSPPVLGRFFACEVKADRGRETEEQRLFRELVLRFGGFAFVARSVTEAEAGYREAGGKHHG